MTEPLVLWKWWIVDERTGKRRLTSWRMTETDALAAVNAAVRSVFFAAESD